MRYTLRVFTFLLLLFLCFSSVTFAQEREQKKVVKTDEEWKQLLTPKQYYVMRQKGTERPYTGKYNDFFKKGTYICVGCQTPLFRSSAKFNAGCGWPSFWESIDKQSIRYQHDNSLHMSRVEILCNTCDAHLGHVFKDGPPPTGLRYCLNSVALNFVSDEK